MFFPPLSAAPVNPKSALKSKIVAEFVVSHDMSLGLVELFLPLYFCLIIKLIINVFFSLSAA